MGPLMDLPMPTVVSPHPDVPSLFVMSIVLPAGAPVIMRPPDDGCVSNPHDDAATRLPMYSPS